MWYAIVVLLLIPIVFALLFRWLGIPLAMLYSGCFTLWQSVQPQNGEEADLDFGFAASALLTSLLAGMLSGASSLVWVKVIWSRWFLGRHDQDPNRWLP